MPGSAKIAVLVILHLLTRCQSGFVDFYVEKAAELEAEESGVRKPFTLEDVITSAYASDSFNGSWASETEIFYRVDDYLLKFDVKARKSEVLAKNGIFDDDSKHLKFYLSPDKNYVLIRNETESIYRHSTLSQFKIYNVNNKTTTPLADGQLLSIAFWAPEGSSLIYVLNNDLYYHQINGDYTETRRLTFDGKSQAVYNGVPDWVYEEEVFGTDRAAWISPKGEHLAFATFNDTQVPYAIISRYGTPGDMKNQYPEEEKFRYPKSGATNPVVTLNVVDLADHGSSLITLPAPTDMVGPEPVLYAVTWFDPKTVVATWTNRVQNISQMVSYALDGRWQPLLYQEVLDGWLQYPDSEPIYHKGYVIVHKLQPVGEQSNDLYAHVTRYRLLNGVMDRELDLTPGGYWVHQIHGVNDAKRLVYFTASPPGKHSQKHLYEVSLEARGGSQPKCISCELKSPEGNPCNYVSSASFSKDLSHYVLTCSGPDPDTVKVYDLEGAELYTWAGNKQLRQMLEKRLLPKQMDLDVESGGFTAKVRLLLPPGFDERKKYPMLVNVYAGPQSQKITDSFAVGFESYVTTNRNVVHATIDGRGSASRGTANMYAVYRRLGSAEMDDQINVTSHLQRTYRWIDSNKTAIWGWSYGGYSTASVLAKDLSDVFKCGISVAPVTNWIYYDSIYTERYMGLPTADDNLGGYQEGSVMEHVSNLRSKKFMLIHGTGDDNVHYQQSMALSKALAEADIIYDQVSYADEAHGLSHVTKHLYHTMDKFWDECYDYSSIGKSGRRGETL